MRAVTLALVGMLMVAGSAMAAGPEDDRVLSDRELQAEMQMNRRLDAYVDRNGYPDVAAWRFLSDDRPWDEHEVTLYYLDDHREISFARAWILGEPSVHLEKSDHVMTQEEVDRMRPLARSYGVAGACTGSAAERAETAAARAENAAARVDAAATAAERAAERAEAVVDKMTARAHRSARK